MIPEQRNLKAIADSVSEKHRNLLIASLNDSCVRLAVNEDSTYDWHRHPNSDELFIVLEGELRIEFRDRHSVTLKPEDIYIVPTGVVHRTIAKGQTVNLCFEKTLSETVFETEVASGTTRPPFIRNLSSIPDEAHYIDPEPEKYRTRKRLGKATGAESLGLNLCRLGSGQVSSRLHAHSKEEEFFLIQSGRAVLRHGQNRYEVSSGDCISIRPDGTPHQLINPFQEECIYLVVSTCEMGDQISYPEPLNEAAPLEQGSAG